MKRIFFLVASLAIFTNAKAQYLLRKNTGNFTGIEISSAAHVNLFQSDSSYVTFSSKDSFEKVPKVDVHGGVLEITSLFRGTINVYVQNITSIHVSDAARVSCKDTLKTDNLTVRVSGAGKADILAHAKVIKARASDAGSITLGGMADSLDVKASDASRVTGTSLKVNGVRVISSDGSSASVWAVKDIDANATDGSTVHVKGAPTQKNTSASDGGSVTMDETGEETTPVYGKHSDIEDDSVSGKKHTGYKYGEGFIGMGFVTGGNNGVPIKYGASREFIMGFGNAYKFLKWNAIGWDIYYKSTGYYFAQNLPKRFPDTIQHNAQKISLQNFGGFVYDRFIFASGYHGKLALDIGFYFDWTFNSREVNWDNNSSIKTIDRGLSITNPTNYGLTARLEFVRGLSCYFSCRLSKVFNYSDSPTLPACVLGITIGLVQ